MLVFISQGSVGQIVFAMCLAFISFGVYLRCSPFDKDEDDVIAVTAQVSIFFSLFAALLTKVGKFGDDGEANDETWNSDFLSLVLIVCSLGESRLLDCFCKRWRRRRRRRRRRGEGGGGGALYFVRGR